MKKKKKQVLGYSETWLWMLHYPLNNSDLASVIFSEPQFHYL